MAAQNRIARWLQCALLLISLTSNASIPVKSMVVFGDSLSDVGNTTHLLKSLRKEEDPSFIVTPFKRFVINRMNDFADEYYVPQVVLNAGIALVEDFFDNQVATRITDLIAKMRLVPILPVQPYWNYRFSNGPVWSEHLAEMLSVRRDTEETYTNKAFGGSWAATYDHQLTVWNLIRHPIGTIKNLIVGKLIPPSLALTVHAYLLERREINNESVYFLFSGGNDYLNVFNFKKNYEQHAMSRYIDNVLDNFATSVYKLEHAGARRFVIMGLPFLGETPRFINSADREALNAAIAQHNERLKQRITDWQISYPQTDFLYVDLQEYFSKAISTPEQFGFTNTTNACIDITFPMFSAFANSPFANNYVLQYQQVLHYHDKRLASGEKNYQVCNTPDSYLFWDDVHPSARAHRHLAYEVCRVMHEHGYDVSCKRP